MNEEMSNDLYERAVKHMPGGVNSPVRAYKAVDRVPRFIASAKGDRITDVDGNEMIDYIKNNVMEDYVGFVKSGHQYSNDAVHVSEIVSKFNDMASSIKSSMSNVAESLDGISSAIEESTNGITTVATNTTDLVAGIEDISSEMTTNEQISNELKDEADRFVTL